jgi:hypothetical protein
VETYRRNSELEAMNDISSISRASLATSETDRGRGEGRMVGWWGVYKGQNGWQISVL